MGLQEVELKQLRWWLFEDVLLWILALGFAAFCAVMVLTFWTNVSWDVQQSFAFVSLTYVLQWYIMEPIERAIMCASFGTFLWWKKQNFVCEQIEIAKTLGAMTREF